MTRRITIHEYLTESMKAPTFSAAEVYQQLRSTPVSSPEFSKELHTVIDYLSAEICRFEKEDKNWLFNKIEELTAEYAAYWDAKEKEMAVNKMKMLMLKRAAKKKQLPPSSGGDYIDYTKSE